MLAKTGNPSCCPWLTAKTGDPKGNAPWNPDERMKLVAQDVRDVVAMLRKAMALPVGPRTIGYRLSMRENASGLRYVKAHYDEHGKLSKKVVDGYATFKDVEKAVKRLRQCKDRGCRWEDISDGSAVSHLVPGFDSVDDWASNRLDPDTFSRDLRYGQPVVVEIYSESAELTPLIDRVAREYGVRTYSGRGSGGPDLARKAAIRARHRFFEDDNNGMPGGTRTLILGIGDLDHAGVTGVMRPHVEHVGAFLAGMSLQRDPLLAATEMLDFRRVAIMPEQAIEANEALGIDVGALASYRDSGVCDWTRDARLLHDCPKTETEALDPVVLRDLIRKALEDALDMSVLEAVKAEQEEQRLEIGGLRKKLGLETNDGTDDRNDAGSLS